MKKLLAILGACALTASGAGSVVACGDSSTDTTKDIAAASFDATNTILTVTFDKAADGAITATDGTGFVVAPKAAASTVAADNLTISTVVFSNDNKTATVTLSAAATTNVTVTYKGGASKDATLSVPVVAQDLSKIIASGITDGTINGGDDSYTDISQVKAAILTQFKVKTFTDFDWTKVTESEISVMIYATGKTDKELTLAEIQDAKTTAFDVILKAADGAKSVSGTTAAIAFTDTHTAVVAQDLSKITATGMTDAKINASDAKYTSVDLIKTDLLAQFRANKFDGFIWKDVKDTEIIVSIYATGKTDKELTLEQIKDKATTAFDVILKAADNAKSVSGTTTAIPFAVSHDAPVVAQDLSKIIASKITDGTINGADASYKDISQVKAAILTQFTAKTFTDFDWTKVTESEISVMIYATGTTDKELTLAEIQDAKTTAFDVILKAADGAKSVSGTTAAISFTDTHDVAAPTLKAVAWGATKNADIVITLSGDAAQLLVAGDLKITSDKEQKVSVDFAVTSGTTPTASTITVTLKAPLTTGSVFVGAATATFTASIPMEIAFAK